MTPSRSYTDRAVPRRLLALLSACLACAPAQASAGPSAINQPYADPDKTRAWDRRFTAEDREVAARKADVLKDLSLRPGATIADVGAGTGLYTLDLARAVGDAGRVFAVDVIPHFLRHIERRARKAGLTNITYVRATQRSPGLAEASIDLAFLCDSYHHLERPAELLAELRRALRPDGVLVVLDLERVPGVTPAPIVAHVRAGKAEVLAELEAAGFTLVEDRTAALGLQDNYLLRLRPVVP